MQTILSGSYIVTTAATISIEPPSRCRQDCLHHEMIFTNARLIFPDGIHDGLEVVVEQGKIAAIRPPTPRLPRTGEPVVESVSGSDLAHRDHFAHAAQVIEEHDVRDTLDDVHRLGLTEVLVRANIHAFHVHDHHLMELIGRVVVGADSVPQLNQIIGASTDVFHSDLPDLSCDAEDLINPARWSRL